jgi:hypothetical protein
LVLPHVFGPHRFQPEELPRAVIQLAADLLTNLLPLLGLALHFHWLEDLLHHFQVLRGAHSLGAGAFPFGRPQARRRHHLDGTFLQPDHQQFQLGAAELLALLAKAPPGQRVELLAQEHRFLPRGLQLLLQRRDLLAQSGVLFLQLRVRHRVGDPIEARPFSFKLPAKYFRVGSRALVPGAPCALFEIHAVEQQLQRLRRQAKLGRGLARALGKIEATLLQSFGQDDHARAVKVEDLDSIAAVIAENEQRPTARVFPQLSLGGVPQAIEAGP